VGVGEDHGVPEQSGTPVLFVAAQPVPGSNNVGGGDDIRID